MLSKSLTRILGLVVVLMFIFAATTSAQSAMNLTINYVDTTNFPEVRLNITAADAQGNPVTGLNKNNFALTENGQAINVDSLSSQLDQMYVVLMLDTTGSMLDVDPTSKLPTIEILKNSAKAFVESLSPQDVVAVYTFNETQSLRCDFTTDRKAINDCLSNISAESKWTALWDSAFTAINKATEIPRGRRAVILFTDGVDNVSKLNADDVVSKATGSQIPVYTIAAGSEINAKDLGRVSLLTNGQSLTSPRSSDIPKLFDTLSKQLKNQYALVYTSSAPEGKVDLKVRVSSNGLAQETATTFPVPGPTSPIPPFVPPVDATQFPDVKVSVSAPELPAGVPITPTLANFSVQEDGNQTEPKSLATDKRGALVQIVLDTSVDLTQKGATQNTIWAEQRSALLELADTDKWLDKSGQTDLVSIASSKDDPSRPNVKFTNDYTLLHNFAYDDKLPPPGSLSFDQLVRQGIDAIVQNGPADGRRRMMIAFSNGIQATTDVAKLQELPDLAKQNYISVFVVYFGSSELSAPAVNLRKVASAANWRYYWYTSLSSLQSVYQQIGNFRTQYSMTYRSKAATTGNHQVRVAVQAEGGKEISAESQYGITIAPPQAKVTFPDGFVRQGNRWDAPPSEWVPTTMPISVNFEWPDGHKRNITKISYVIDKGVEQEVGNVFSDAGTIPLDVSGLGQGNHTLDILFQDELGIQSQAAGIAMPIPVSLPPKPWTVQVVEFATRYYPIAAVAFSILLLGLAVYVYRQRPAMVMGAVTAVRSGVKVATDFFVRPKAGERKTAKAYLMPIAGGDATRQEPIPLRAETTRLGRDDSWANIVLQDTSVSRLHAKIVEEQDGAFKIYDEGSKSGSYVNEEEVTDKGQWLREGDVIALGRDEFQFKLKLVKESTEVYERSQPRASGQKAGGVAGSANVTTDEVPSTSKESTEILVPRTVKPSNRRSKS